VILEAVSIYNLGNSISDTQRTIRKRLHVDIPEGTIRSWIRSHKPLTAYARMRVIGSKLFKAEANISEPGRHKQRQVATKWKQKLCCVGKIEAHQ